MSDKKEVLRRVRLDLILERHVDLDSHTDARADLDQVAGAWPPTCPRRSTAYACSTSRAGRGRNPSTSRGGVRW